MTLSEEDFPLLSYKIQHTKLGFCLYNILSEMAAHDKPICTFSDGSAWYALPLNYLVSRYSGSKRTWQSNVTLAVSLGLLRKLKPDADSIHPALQQLYRDGLQHGKAPKNLYSVPAYTLELFAEAESALEQWEQTGVSTARITKASVSHAQGKAQANTIFRDNRTKAATKALEAAHRIVERIVQAVRQRGYTTKSDAVRGDVKAWDMLRGYILDEAGARYHRPTKEDIARYNLTDSAWIISARAKNI